MPKVFLSYARGDLDAARQVEQALVAQGGEVWRDQKSLYGGERWPKAIGEAVASSDALVLVWSARAAQSYFVEFEWTTALALKRAIIPCLLDDTPLPPALSAVNALPSRDLEAALPAIIQAALGSAAWPDPARESKVMDKLRKIEPGEPVEVLRQARAVFKQEGWVVSGTSYNAGGNIVVNQTPWWVAVVVLAAIAAVVLVVIVVSLPQRDDRRDGGNVVNVNGGPVNGSGENTNAGPRSSFTGYVQDKDGRPIEGASVEVKELSGQTLRITGTSTSDGDFHIDNIPAAVGARGVVVVTADGYKPRSESIVLPGPKTIEMERLR